jgi:hypothetical protein
VADDETDLDDVDEAAARALGRRRSAPKAFGVVLLVVLASVAGLLLWQRGPIPQPPGYHAFADTRTMYRVPNALNVASNVFFLIVGLLGLVFLGRGPGPDPHAPRPRGAHVAFATYRERPAYVIFFTGILLTAFGSGWYHLAPSTPRLFWDRLPMAIAFMGLFAAVIAERVDLYWSRVLLLPLVALGVASVVLWKISEDRGAGDLRAYVFVQGFPMIAIPMMMALFASPYTRSAELVLVLVVYAGAKVLEHFDAAVFEATGRVVSGHTLKHVAAAFACWVVLDMLKGRVVRETE